MYVRERQGVELVRPLAPADLPVGLAADPVFLLPQTAYAALLPRTRCFGRPTLVAYIVNWRCAADAYLDELEALAASRGEGLAVIAGQGSEDFVPARLRFDCGPVGFLHAVRDAAAVVTNSFHGIVFALVFGRPFVYVPQRNETGSDQNVRQRELLERFGLGGRECPAGELAAAGERLAPLPAGTGSVLESVRRKAGTALGRCLEG